MLKKLFYFLPIFLISVFLIWEYKVNILLWSIPKIASITMPVQENIPTSWSKGPKVASEDDRPNIILILADDMGYNDISMHNGGAADGTLQTQNIDALAKSGMLFTRGYAANATCAPSRASIMTGKYPTRFGYEFTPVPATGRLIMNWLANESDEKLRARIDREVASKIPPFMQQGMPTEEITIAEVLRDAGYYTAHIGKWHLGHAYGMDPLSQGFQDSLSMVGPLYLPEDHPDVVNAKFDTTIDQMIWGIGQYSATFNEGELFAPDKYLTDYYTDEALKVIENNKNRPFFLYLSHWAIHNPLQALRSDVEQMSHMEGHNLQVYSGMIAALDRSVGKVVQKLKELDIHGKTLIIFTSDNGGAQYIGLPDVNKPFRGWKLNHFEGGTHVPFMAKWPAKIPEGSELAAPVHHVDLFHTIAAAAQAPVPTDRVMDGVDLMPFVTGDAQGVPHETLFWRQGHHQSVRHRDWKLIRAENLTKDGKREEAVWLFDLAADPRERINLVDERPDMVTELQGLLAAHNAEQAEPIWPSVMDSPQLIDKDATRAYAEGDEYIYFPN